MQDQRVKDVYRSYFQFNNERTLSTDLESELFSIVFEGCSVFVDKTRKYDNQIFISLLKVVSKMTKLFW